MKFLGGFQVPLLPAPPATPAAGQMYFNTTNFTFYGWNGTGWISLKPDGGNADTLDGLDAADFMPKGPVTWGQLKGV